MGYFQFYLFIVELNWIGIRASFEYLGYMTTHGSIMKHKIVGCVFRKCIFSEGRSKELPKMGCMGGVKGFIHIYIYYIYIFPIIDISYQPIG